MTTNYKIRLTDVIRKKQIKLYKKLQTKYLITTRFSNETWSENIYYRSKIDVSCIYCSPCPISSLVPDNSILFVLEMNNDINKLMGVGMVRNSPRYNANRVYNNGSYNRYSYIGSERIDRKDMEAEENTVFAALEYLCFKGNKHMKRGYGLTGFPMETLLECSNNINLVDFISKMFKQRLLEKNTKSVLQNNYSK
jgi:hypothetical protein